MSSHGSNSPRYLHRESTVIFDPFLLREDHQEHYNSTTIIKIEKSDRIFCPTCLENTPAHEICRVNQDVYNQYVRNFFEALDQYSEVPNLRGLFLPLLEIILKKRPVTAKSDYEFHKFVRIIYRLMKSELFDLSEFCHIARIYKSVTSNFVKSHPLPLNTVWQASKHLLDQGESILKRELKISSQRTGASFLAIRGSLAAIINMYLESFDRFDKVSELMFPIYQNDTPENHCRIYSRTSQNFCIDYLLEHIITELATDAKPLRSQADCDAITEIFGCLDRCLKSAIHLKKFEFPQHLIALDLIYLSNAIMRENPGSKCLTSQIRAFIKNYVVYFVDQYLGSDECFEKFSKGDDIVELNGRSALKLYGRNNRLDRVKFYLLAGFVAIKQDSKFFVKHRFERLIRIFDPKILIDTKTMLKAYNFVVASLIPEIGLNIDSHPEIQRFIMGILGILSNRSNGCELINEIYCYEEKTFYLVYQNPEFIKLANTEMIRYFLEKGSHIDTLRKNLYLLIRDRNYNALVTKYLVHSDKSADVVVNALKINEDSYASDENLPVEHLTSELSALVSSLLHESVLNSISAPNETVGNVQLIRLAIIVVRILDECKYFIVTFDDQFIEDFLNLVEKSYNDYIYGRNQDTEIIVLLNELITSIFITHDLSLMKLISRLDYAVLGYMYQCIADYTKGDTLSESIARLLVAYDSIDYPLRYTVSSNLYPLAESAFSWMLSDNEDLHRLSMIGFGKIMRHNEISVTTRVTMSVGLMHMIYRNPSILNKTLHLNIFASLVDFEEITCNPLLSRILPLIPEPVRSIFTEDGNSSEDLQPNLDLSFESDLDQDDNESIGLNNVIEEAIELVDRLERPDAMRGIPNFIYASRGVDEGLHGASDVMDEADEFEKMAHETTQG